MYIHIYVYRDSDPSVMVMSNEVFMREREIESALVKAVKQKHGMALKLTSPGLDGVPDRLILFENGRINAMKSYKAIRHAAILICFSMIFISAAKAEDYKMIHIDSVDDSCSRICNIPPA